MRKFFFTLFSILLIALASIGGGLLLSISSNNYSGNLGSQIDDSSTNNKHDEVSDLDSCTVTYDANGGVGGTTQSVTVSNSSNIIFSKGIKRRI